MRNFKENLQWVYSFNAKANFKNMGTTLFLIAQGIRKSFHHVCILMFSLDTCICLHMVEDCKFSTF